MTSLFIKLLNLSISAGMLILLVFVLRFILKRTSRRATCLLWVVVGLRLVIPFSFESSLSIMPSGDFVKLETAPEAVEVAYTGNENNIGGQSHKITLYDTTTDDDSEINYYIDSAQTNDFEKGLNNSKNDAEQSSIENDNIEQSINIKNAIEQDYTEQNNDIKIALPTQMPNDTVKTQSNNNDNVQRNGSDNSTSEDYYVSTSNNILGYPAKYFWGVIAYLWLFGVVAIMGYALVGYIHMKQITAASMKLEDLILSEGVVSRFKIKLENVYVCDRLDTAFIFGIIHPRIYLPSNLDETQIENVIAHEHVHIMRRDYIWKLIGFLMLAVYWFNPLVWLAYAFLCRDIEFACDEQVISGMSTDEVKRYSETLLYCSTNLHFMYGCPLAFGEIAVKDRVKAVLNYKKPLFWVILLVFVLLITAGIFFFAKPSGKKVEPENDKTQEGENIVRNDNTVTADEITPEPQIVETIEEGGKTYYKLSDGTYKYGYNTYKYRLEISGRSYGNDFDTVLIYLSNDEDIPFQRAEINTGMLSSSSQYIPKYEAVFIDHYKRTNDGEIIRHQDVTDESDDLFDEVKNHVDIDSTYKLLNALSMKYRYSVVHDFDFIYVMPNGTEFGTEFGYSAGMDFREYCKLWNDFEEIIVDESLTEPWRENRLTERGYLVLATNEGYDDSQYGYKIFIKDR